MAGQVKHTQIFSSIRPDWRLAKLLLNLRTRNTDMLLGAVAKVLADEGIELISSTTTLSRSCPNPASSPSARPPTMKRNDIAYGRTVARALAAYDLGQTVVIAAQACVAVEAMEGTDATIERAGALMRRLNDPASTLSRSLTVVKVAKPNQDMRFDVPVIGVATIEAMARAGATCLAVEAGAPCSSTLRPSSRLPTTRHRHRCRIPLRTCSVTRAKREGYYSHTRGVRAANRSPQHPFWTTRRRRWFAKVYGSQSSSAS